MPDLRSESADVTIGLLDSPEQLVVRREALERVETKLLHLLRAVRKARISGASPAIRTALTRHAEEFAGLLRQS